ncbi:MAG: hypothetical protein R3264_12130, partial [Anaerolineae bacterium]|nr:hypothetical protein [Anaerolineae bacterium]
MNVVSEIKLFKQIRSITPSAQLTLIAVLSGLIYLLLFTLPFPLTRYYNTIPPVDYTKLTNYSPVWLTSYVIGISLLFLLYLAGLRLVMHKAASTRGSTGQTENPVSLPFVLGSSFSLALISVFAYPLTAIDLFIYAIRTRGWAVYDLNPLATAPEMLPAADPWLGLAAEWVDAPSPYGPLWELLSLGLFTLSGGNFLTHLLALKLLMVIIYLGCAGLIYLTLRRLQPAWATAGTLAFAWNPLVIFESVQNAHNDIVMTFFLLAAVWAFAVWVTVSDSLQRKPSHFYPWLICIFLALSVLVKFVTIIAVPFFMVAMAARFYGWWVRASSLVGYGLLTLALIIVPMLPLWPG